MSQHEKLKERFLKQPNDFAYDELKRLLSHYGYKEKQGRGSRAVFINAITKDKIKVHKPHPDNIIKICYLIDIANKLKRKGLIE